MKNIVLLMMLVSVLVSANMWGKNHNNMRSNTTASEITEDQKDELLYIYQEEKVARDVYITLGKLYPHERTFRNIQKSEQKHMDAVEKMCVKYDVDITGVDETEVGVFVLPELQALYDELIERGSDSLLDALYVGELIEIMDIKDLEDAAVGMPADVQKVFFNLKQGSLWHLNAFQNATSRESK